MTFPTVVYDKQESVAVVTLSRPEVLNAFNVQMRDDLAEVLSAVRDDDDVRALVLRGAGRAFCAGADLTEFGSAPSPSIARRVRFARDVWAELEYLPVPSVAALHGFALGSGLEMALFCDLRIAAAGTRFALPEVQRGLIPGAGGTQTLSRVCGIGPALDLLLTARQVEAEEALRLGLISEIVGGEDLDERAMQLAFRLAELSVSAVRAVRRAVREGADLSLEQGLRLEAQLAASLRSTA